MTKFLIRTLLIFFLSFWQTQFSFAQQNQTYFYHGLDYGSEAAYNPLTLIVNGGFGIMQINNRSSSLRSVDFKQGYRNVMDNICHPVREIKKYGVKKFIFSEIIPGKLKIKNAQYFPNYQLHIIGGGMTFRALDDWYAFHQFKYSKISALLTLSAYHFLNEVVENNQFQGTNIDAIADLLIFDPLGALLFYFDPVARFFGHTLHMADWSFQPMVSLYSATLENNGQNFSIKYQLPRSEKWSLFYFFGVHGLVGLSYKKSGGEAFSFGGGLIAKDLIETKYDNDTRSLTTSLMWTGGFFYDRNNSLLASLILAGTKGYVVRLNIYPGLIFPGRFSPGLFLAIGKYNELIMGVQFRFTPVGCAAFF